MGPFLEPPLIGNIQRHINGWCLREHIFGILVDSDGRLRDGERTVHCTLIPFSQGSAKRPTKSPPPAGASSTCTAGSGGPLRQLVATALAATALGLRLSHGPLQLFLLGVRVDDRTEAHHGRGRDV